MDVQEGLYTINVFNDGKKINNESRSISFSLKDSIYKVTSESSFTIFDGKGISQEFYAIIEGTTFEVEFGIPNALANRAEYIITRESLDEIKEAGILSGDVHYIMKPAWEFAKGLSSKAYRGTPAEVLRQLLSTYKFKLNLETSENFQTSTFYQPLVSDVDFIHEQITPFAFSKDSHNTPFYSFFTTDGVFNFKSLDAMFVEEPVSAYTYKRVTDASIFGIVFSLKRWKEDLDIYTQDLSYSTFEINRQSGMLVENKLNAFNHGLTSETSYVPIEFKTDEAYGFQNLMYNDDDLVNGFNGVRNSKQKRSMLYDRFIILVQQNPYLHAGKCILLNIEMFGGGNNKTNSTVYSGKYLIEECEHIWDGTTMRGYTKLIVGRRFVSLNNGANNKVKRLFKK